MVLQLSDKDNAKEVLNFENMNSRDNQLSGVVELLRSELLFQRAVKSMGMNVSLYSRGKVLTEELYLKSNFYVQPFALNDSSLIGKEINIMFHDDDVKLSYLKAGKTIDLKGKVNEHLINEDFDVVLKVVDKKGFKEATDINDLYYTFNSIESVTDRLKTGLKVSPLEINAKTISISFRGIILNYVMM